jgi:5,10-methylene-tetrahydrofolate dehydrogenase/methenyl tetrahydrofolate cyclohydrolase
MPAVLFESAPIVEQMTHDLREQVADLPDDLPFEGRLSVIATLPEDPPTLSYLSRMAVQTESLGLAFDPHYFRGDEDAALAKTIELNDADGSATMIMIPLSNPTRELEFRQAVHPERDPDALGWIPDASGQYPAVYPNYPATPLSVLRLAEHAAGAPLEQLIISGDLDPERLVFYGRGKLVNMPAEEILRQRLAAMGVSDVDFTVISRENRNTDLIETLGDRADIVLAAAGSTAAAGALKPEFLRRGTGSRREPLVVVDAAFCTGPDGKPYGNLNPAIYDPTLGFTVMVTPYSERRGPIRGVGPLTAAYLLRHTVEAVQRDADRFRITSRI